MKIEGKNPPSFQRLQGQLTKLIAETTAGERLPSEPLLARQLGVSRATLREAMRTFESQGVIRRRQGIGTFVVNRKQVIDTGLEVLESIETLAKKIQLDVSMGDLETRKINADLEYASIFGRPEGSSLVQVKRVIVAENRPVAFLQDMIPEDILPLGDLKEDFTGSVLDLLLKNETLQLSHSSTEIRSVAAPSEIARALQVQRGDALLLFTARLYDVNQQVVDYSFSHFLPGYFRFHVIRSVEQSRKL